MAGIADGNDMRLENPRAASPRTSAPRPNDWKIGGAATLASPALPPRITLGGRARSCDGLKIVSALHAAALTY
jgi:hypothetical protein